jgi:3-dehydroquinate synthase
VFAKLHIKLGERGYSIHFGTSLESILAEAGLTPSLRPGNDVLLTDAVVEQSQLKLLDSVLAGLPRIVLSAGEQTKSLQSFGRVLDALAAQGVNRGSTLWVMGGGVMGDLGGFAAASYLRGISYVQIPTTLLAMVDSSIGGKTGVNLSAGKNLVGAFHHPGVVLIATDFLRTLPPRDFAAGMAEVIKYGLLGDEVLFGQLERAPLTATSAELLATIRRCCEMKALIVQADERETAAEDGRALLNLGHTFGHAIEQATGYSAYLHGEAVAVGLAAAARLSQKLGLVTASDVRRVERVLAAHGLPVALREPLPLAALTAAMLRDKKVRAGRLRFVVLRQLGAAATRNDVEPVLVDEVWRELGAG